ncbi:MAG: hypothetical protein ABI702_07325 [Burkholderiales bacterium]
MHADRPPGRAMSTRLTMALSALLALPIQGRADERSDRIEILEKRLVESLKLIERLESRVTELEQSQNGRAAKPEGGPVAASASAPGHGTERVEAQATSKAIATLQEEFSQLSESLSKSTTEAGLPLHGFADVGAGWSSRSDPNRQRGFRAGTLDLYLVPQFGDRVRSLIEVAFEYEPDGRQATVEVERLQLGYTLRDDLTLWLGRFHTPFGLWNTMYHHGANFQTAIDRPRFIEFEDHGGIMPAHSIGVWASGKFVLGGDKLAYDAYLSNGPSIRKRTLDFNAVTDDDQRKMLGFNIGYQPSGALRGLTVGLHGFDTRATTYSSADEPLSRTRLRMGGGYFGYDANDWEAIGEYYRFANRDAASGITYGSSAWFVQAGRSFGAWTPFARYEHTSLNPQDRYFTSQQWARSYRRSVAGARYALDGRSSFKIELSSTREAPLSQLDENGVFVQFSGASYRRLAFQYSIAF